MNKRQALRVICSEVLGRNNLIGSDFANIGARDVDRQFQQGRGGVRVQFTISYHALGKIDTDELIEAFQVLGARKGDDG